MKTTKVKFLIGDTVYLLIENKIKSGTVEYLEVNRTSHFYGIEVDATHIRIEQHYIHATKQDLKDSL